MNMPGILVHSINDCLYKMRQTYISELERRKHMKCHIAEFERNFVQTYSNSSA